MYRPCGCASSYVDNGLGAAIESPTTMASNTAATSVKRKNKHQKAGRKRKNALAKKSTLSMTELFAKMGAPGKPAPKG